MPLGVGVFVIVGQLILTVSSRHRPANTGRSLPHYRRDALPPTLRLGCRREEPTAVLWSLEKFQRESNTAAETQRRNA